MYLTTFAAGAMRINFTLFCLIGPRGAALPPLRRARLDPLDRLGG